MKVWSYLLFIGLFLWSVDGRAVIETYEFASAELEARYHRLSQELRCPKCQNQNIADSNAPIARDLRVVLHEQLESGASDDEILAFMVARYGEFVRYRPDVDRNTIWLWTAPVLLLGLGVVALGWHLRARRSGGQSPLTPAEQARVEALLKGSRN
ncbi:MAG: cytochrome c-type biogenesis protein CcmH [Luminiphilus sp.]|jgi:cytochrome c-type biogenesis protein CcmH|nr:cytochrome c-type biogenesis protein CcmH [Luminiphilus sp.]